jgi:hypothetical protein
VADKTSFYDKYFRNAEGRKKVASKLAQESKKILSKYDPQLVETVRRRKNSGESLRQIYQDLGENPDVLDIGLQVSILSQSEDIRGDK